MHKILIPIFLLLFTTYLANATNDFPVPRWVSLKGDANLRKGPHMLATIIYRYEFPNYPMEIIQDAGDWKKVVDRRDGVTGWMNKILFSGKRYAITKTSPYSFGYDKPSKNKIIAKISSDVHVKLEECDTVFCKISLEHQNKNLKLWIEKSNLIGVYMNEIIE